MAPRNPFTPTFGKVPPHIAGREDILDDMAYAFDNGPGDPNLSSIIVGPRGTGKTALLSLISEEAAARGWITASVSAAPGMLEDILQRSYETAAEFVDSQARLHIREIGIPQLVNVAFDRPDAGKANWRTRMNALFKELAKHDMGLLITIDEVTVALDEMVQFASTYQHFVRENKRVGLVMAGLPYQVSELVDDERISFLRRSRRWQLGRLSDADVENAFLATVEDAGKEIGREALALAVEASDGFPYMMQLVGYRCWAASRGDAITTADVERGTRHAFDEFRTGVIEASFGELSPTDVRFCDAMLGCGEGCSLADVSAAMGVKSNYASQYKKRLLTAGIIDERAGGLRFSLPGFADYLRDRRA